MKTKLISLSLFVLGIFFATSCNLNNEELAPLQENSNQRILDNKGATISKYSGDLTQGEYVEFKITPHGYSANEYSWTASHGCTYISKRGNIGRFKIHANATSLSVRGTASRKSGNTIYESVTTSKYYSVNKKVSACELLNSVRLRASSSGGYLASNGKVYCTFYLDNVPSNATVEWGAFYFGGPQPRLINPTKSSVTMEFPNYVGAITANARVTYDGCQVVPSANAPVRR